MQVKYTRGINLEGQTDIEITDITLLSMSEIEAAQSVANLKAKRDWWLCSPGLIYGRTKIVRGEYGDVYVYSTFKKLGVRPVLKISNFNTSNLQIGDKIEVAGCKWTVISDKLILCDDIVGESCYQKKRETDNVNTYETSDVKRWLENWWSEVSTAQ